MWLWDWCVPASGSALGYSTHIYRAYMHTFLLYKAVVIYIYSIYIHAHSFPFEISPIPTSDCTWAAFRTGCTPLSALSRPLSISSNSAAHFCISRASRACSRRRSLLDLESISAAAHFWISSISAAAAAHFLILSISSVKSSVASGPMPTRVMHGHMTDEARGSMTYE